MTDKENTETPPASAPAASAPPVAAAPVVRESGSWATPLVAALVVVAALVIGGVGGFALAAVGHADSRPAIVNTSQSGPDREGPHHRGPQPDRDTMPGDRDERPHPPIGDSDDAPTEQPVQPSEG